MTRINLGIHSKELPDKLLLAEHREIKRIPNMLLKGRYKLASAPSNFCLGKGHVAFFYDKQAFLFERYESLFYECLERGFHVTDYSESFNRVKANLPHLWGSYLPSKRDRALLIQRIKSKGFSLIQQQQQNQQNQ